MTDEEYKQLNQLAKDLELIKSLQLSDVYTPKYQEAMPLFSLGYRKADEVRKETAAEILSAVDNESNGQTISITNYLRKKYGVEVKE